MYKRGGITLCYSILVVQLISKNCAIFKKEKVRLGIYFVFGTLIAYIDHYLGFTLYGKNPMCCF